MDFIDYDVDYNYSPHGGGGGGVTHSSAQTDVLASYKCVLLNYPVNSSSYSSLNYYSLWLFKNNILYPPSEFTPFHHVIFQVSQLILCAYVCACKKSVISFIILSIYALIQGFWGLFVLKSFDVCVWHGIVLLILLTRLCGVLCCDGKGRKSPGGRRVKGSNVGRGVIVSGSSYGVKSGGGEELRDVYLRLFAPVRVSYKQFMKVVQCKRGFRVLGCGENYSVEKRSRVDSLGLLVSGRLVVCQGGKPLHVILPFQFVDSPEYFGVATDELFQVTITALEESKLLVWHRDKLRLTIMNDEFLSTIFQHILSRDVCRKLISVSDTMVTTPTTTTYSSSTTTNTNTAISPSTSSSSSTTTQQQNNPSNGTVNQSSSPNSLNGTTTLLTTLTPTHGTNTTTTTTTTQQQQPIIMLRKEKYYQPTYLSSLSEEKLNGNGNKLNGGFNEEEDDDDLDEEEEEEEEDDDEERGLDTVVFVSSNEKEPMLVESCGSGGGGNVKGGGGGGGVINGD